MERPPAKVIITHFRGFAASQVGFVRMRVMDADKRLTDESPSTKADIVRIEGKIDALAVQMKLLTVLTAGVCVAMALLVASVVADRL